MRELLRFRLVSSPFIVLFAAAVLLNPLCGTTLAVPIDEHFDVDPGWEAVGNTTPPNNFGFSATNHAGGAAGEIGRTFVRAQLGYYADDVGDLDPSTEALTLSGIANMTNPSSGNSLLAWFDKDSSLNWPPANAIMIRTDENDVYLRYGANGSGGEVQLGANVDGAPYRFTLSYNPNGNGGDGSITGTLNGGAPVVLNLGGGEKGAMANLDRFGLLTLYIPDRSNDTTVFYDDLSYTSAVPEPSAWLLGALGGALLFLLGRHIRPR